MTFKGKIKLASQVADQGDALDLSIFKDLEDLCLFNIVNKLKLGSPQKYVLFVTFNWKLFNWELLSKQKYLGLFRREKSWQQIGFKGLPKKEISYLP